MSTDDLSSSDHDVRARHFEWMNQQEVQDRIWADATEGLRQYGRGCWISWSTPVTGEIAGGYVTLDDLRANSEVDAETMRRLTEMITTYDPTVQIVVVIPDHEMWAYKCRRITPDAN